MASSNSTFFSLIFQLAAFKFEQGMKNEKVLFVGGNPSKFSSVQIRCEDIASRLGCNRVYSVREAKQVPTGYSAFFCVKAALRQEEVLKLSKRGVVVWDIIDGFPPRYGVFVYLASTERVKRKFQGYGRVELIPHHHCNFSGIPNSKDCRRPGWIGTMTWYPDLRAVSHDVYDVRKLSAPEVTEVYRNIGIGLNLRAYGSMRALHVNMNSGIKLINCIGFGIPSVSGDEPAYRELGNDCTLFTTLAQYPHSVHMLQNDEHLYHTIRQNCLQLSPQFHISSILNRYQTLINSI